MYSPALGSELPQSDHGEIRGCHGAKYRRAPGDEVLNRVSSPVNVVIVGGHGKIGMRLEKILAERGDSPRGIIRKTEQADDLEKIGAEPIVLDIENVEIDDAVAGADAVVFAAGAGPGSGPARKRTVDYGGAVALVEAAITHGIKRYLMVSSDRRQPSGALERGDEAVLRGQGGGRQVPDGERARLHDRAPRSASPTTPAPAR